MDEKGDLTFQKGHLIFLIFTPLSYDTEIKYVFEQMHIFRIIDTP